MSEKLDVPVATHLEDQDNLRMGRDTELLPGQEEEARAMAESIYAHAVERGVKALLFCVSPKQRAIATAELIADDIRKRQPPLHVVVETDSNLREMDQGAFILPQDYQSGDSFEGLKKASKIFMREIRSPDGATYDNFNYHFGDPLPQGDGSYRYPELQQYFTEPGESFREMMSRYVSQALQLAGNLKRFSGKTEPVIFTHGQPQQFFAIFERIAERVPPGDDMPSPDDFLRICRDEYQPRVQGPGSYGKVQFISAEALNRPKVIEFLKKELEHLGESSAS